MAKILRLPMVKLLGALCFVVWMMPQPAWAQNKGDSCSLKDTIRVFVKPTLKGTSVKMRRGDVVRFGARNGKSSRVTHHRGKVGFAKHSWLSQICVWVSPEPAPVKPEPKPAPEPPAEKESPEPAEPEAPQEPPAEPAPEAAPEAEPVWEPVPSEQPQPEPAPAPAPEVKPVDVVTQMAKNEATMAQAKADAPKVRAPSAAAVLTIAVYDLNRENIPEGMARVVTDSLLTEVRKLEGVSAIGMAEIYEMLQHERAKQVMGCEADEACLAQIAGALGVDEIVTGTLIEAADVRSMRLRRIDQRRAGVIQTFEKRLQIGNGEEFLLPIGKAIETLYPERKNRPGTKRGVPEAVLMRINPPPLPTWSTYTVGSLSLVAAALSGVGLWQSSQVGITAKEASEQAAAAGSMMDAQTYMDYESDQKMWQQGAMGAAIAAGTFALSAIVMSLFTDWDGHGSGEGDED